MKPPSGCSSSTIRKTATATETAALTNANIVVAFGGAGNPKKRKMTTQP